MGDKKETRDVTDWKLSYPNLAIASLCKLHLRSICKITLANFDTAITQDDYM